MLAGAGMKTTAVTPPVSPRGQGGHAVVSAPSPDAAEPKDWTLLFYNAGHADESKMCTQALLDLQRTGTDEHTNVVVMNHRSPWLPEKLLGVTRLRKVAGIVRPDLYGKHAAATPAPVQRTAGDLTEQPGPHLGHGLSPWLLHGRRTKEDR